MLARQVMKQRQMGRDEVPFGRKITPSSFVEEGEGAFVELKRQDERCGVVHQRKTRLGAGLFQT
jgi:hypothetical protein